eukprot:CAMPEP_0119392114 /NCGR_PEP_ID=MMETSP1334-20130426/119960_1 /TAXON_ID=127549 /ORGANISM="Calcidiscus leptoporus, Strain RCC1130" /LENGTH=53 /DNA_ID=CAMNT_0007414925 /DNA_START=1 /DNA_END=158 /DNA_ORIENTATION=-
MRSASSLMTWSRRFAAVASKRSSQAGGSEGEARAHGLGGLVVLVLGRGLDDVA